MTDPVFFVDLDQFFAYLEGPGNTLDAIWVGFYKVHCTTPSITYRELVDVCLCLGWIDGKRMSIDKDRWMIRITPRRPKSNWSQVNLKRFAQLEAEGRVRPAGKMAHAVRKDDENNWYAMDQSQVKLAPEYLAEIQANPSAWAFYQKMVPSKKSPSIHWIMSAKQETTRRRRLATFIAFAEKGETIPALQR